jgi:hypothetical protein
MMNGFFNEREMNSSAYHKGKRVGCHCCSLRGKKEESLGLYGGHHKGILNIFECAPGGIDSWLKSKEGQVVFDIFTSQGINIEQDCLNICAVGCADSYKEITDNEINNHRRRVLAVIKEYQPKLINVFGSISMKSIMADRFSGALGEFSKWRGWMVPDQDYKCWVAFMDNPNYVEGHKNEAVSTIWKQDIVKALRHVDIPWMRDKKADIEFISDLSVLKKIKSDMVAVDYETTGIKPHAMGHRIVCASVADTPDHCYAFMMPNKKRERIWFLNLMWNEHIKKMAHNLKYENVWTEKRLRQPVRGWYWDSMLAAHILDNRPNISGLKFQTYINFGVADYSSDISPYLKSEGKDANELNNIHKLLETFGGREKLLTYCGKDTIYQYRLALKQMELMKYDDLPF